MNKKVLTLCAGLLMAGGALSTVDALSFSQAVTLDKNSGALGSKYYCVEMIYEWNGSFSPRSDRFYVTKNGASYILETKNPDFVESGDLDSYWKVELDHTDAQGDWYKLTNAKGELLKVTDKNGVEVKSFLASHEDMNSDTNVDEADGSVLYFYEQTSTGTSVIRRLGWGTGDVIVPEGVAGFNKVACFNLVDIAEQAIKVKDMNAELNGGFMLDFSSKGKEYPNLVGAEAFSGKLTAVSATAGLTDAQKPEDDVFYLRNANGDYIVLSDDYIGDADATLNGTKSAIYRGYNFKTISEHAFNQLDADGKNNAKFSVYKSYDFNDTDSLIVTLPKVSKIGKINSTTVGDLSGKGLRVFVSSVNVAGVKSNMLTTIAYEKCNDRLATVEDDNYADAQLGALAPYISFTTEVPGSIVDIPATFAGKIWNITRGAGENEQSMSPEVNADIDDYAQLFAPISQVDLTNPEGQWLLYKNNEEYYFVNRESGAQFLISNNFKDNSKSWVIRLTDTAGKYEICQNPYTDKWETVYITEAKDAELGLATENGYVKFDMDKELVNGKYFSFETGLGVTAYIGKNADDEVVLTTNKDEAIEFRC